MPVAIEAESKRREIASRGGGDKMVAGFGDELLGDRRANGGQAIDCGHFVFAGQTHQARGADEHKSPCGRKFDAAIERRDRLARELALFDDQAALHKAVRANGRSQTAAHALGQFGRRLAGQAIERAQSGSHGQAKLRARSQTGVLRRRGENVDLASRDVTAVEFAVMKFSPAACELDSPLSQWAGGRQLVGRLNRQHQAGFLDHRSHAAELPARTAGQRPEAEVQSAGGGDVDGARHGRAVGNALCGVPRVKVQRSGFRGDRSRFS